MGLCRVLAIAGLMAGLGVTPLSARAQAPDHLYLSDPSADLRVMFEDTPFDGPAFTDLTGLDVTLSGRVLKVRFDVAERIPTAMPDGVEVLYDLQVDTNGDSSTDYSVDVGSTQGQWVLSVYDHAADEVFGPPSPAVVEGNSVTAEVDIVHLGSPISMRFQGQTQGQLGPDPAVDPYDITVWVDAVPDGAFMGQGPWVGFDGAGKPSGLSTSPAPSGALQWCTTIECGPDTPPVSGWKHLYAVTFSTFREGGRRATYHVYTDRGPLKAVSIATSVHQSRESWPIFDIEVNDLGLEGEVPEPAPVYDDRDEY